MTSMIWGIGTPLKKKHIFGCLKGPRRTFMVKRCEHLWISCKFSAELAQFWPGITTIGVRLGVTKFEKPVAAGRRFSVY